MYVETKETSRADTGFTLVELLIAIIIAALITVVAGQVMSTATRNVATTVDNTVAPQAFNRLTNQIKYDVAGATSVYVYGATAPTTAYCSSKLATAFASWVWTPTGASAVLRALANIRIPTPSSGSGNEWLNLSERLVGYEIRRPAGGASQNLEIWRIECSGSSITKSEMMISMPGIPTGVTLPFGGGFPDGQNFLLCPGTSDRFAGTPTIASGRYSFPTSQAISATVDAAVWFVDTSAYRASAYGLISSITTSSITLNNTSLYANAWPLATGLPPLTGTRFLFAPPCAAGTNTLTANKYLILNPPYYGRSPGLRNVPPITLKSRLSTS